MSDLAGSDDVRALRGEPTWTVRTIEAGHRPMLSAPEELAAMIAEAAAR